MKGVQGMQPAQIFMQQTAIMSAPPSPPQHKGFSSSAQDASTSTTQQSSPVVATGQTPNPDKYTGYLQNVLEVSEKLLGNHVLNKRVVCVTQIIACLALIADVHLATPMGNFALVLPENIRSRVAPEGVDGQWLFYVLMFISLAALIASHTTAGTKYQFQTTVAYVSLSMIVSLAGAGYFVFYGNLWQTREIECGKKNERGAPCTDKWADRLLAERWSGRFLFFQLVQIICMHPSVSHVIVLLSWRRGMERKNSANHNSSGSRQAVAAA
ncbi:hypothetical protein BCR44DRAFT_38238 [Catenaria anguillulae PL171]|uniref:Uncharacterized protein n=1 Tax=Catenaria anguillulae PL171 TaxID=765915 RepID=A0A1Y2HGP3_9FUNG|nr:hypothetical protein BCR44DRAFT_38238 [Catenaria anguillulae PL171]